MCRIGTVHSHLPSGLGLFKLLYKIYEGKILKYDEILVQKVLPKIEFSRLSNKTKTRVKFDQKNPYTRTHNKFYRVVF